MRRGRLIAAIIATALAVELIIVVVTLLGRSPRGPASSSYAVGPTGASGLAAVLERGGHPVRQQRVPVDLEPPDPSATVVVLDGDRPDDREVDTLRAFLADGGRLVVAGDKDTDAWVSSFVGGTMYRSGELLVCRRLRDVAETKGVDEVESSGQPGFATTAGAEPILGCRGSALAAVAKVGKGRLVVIADTAIFQNYLLDARDNATFAVAAMGGVQREVVFLEHLHGFDAQSGLAALPGGWQVALAGAALAGLLALWALHHPGASRNAPPDDHGEAEPLRSVRTLHPAAVAERLGARPLADAAPAVQIIARRAIARAARLPANATEAEVHAAALRLGIPDDDVNAALGSQPTEAAVLAAGRIIAHCAPTRNPT